MKFYRKSFEYCSPWCLQQDHCFVLSKMSYVGYYYWQNDLRIRILVLTCTNLHGKTAPGPVAKKVRFIYWYEYINHVVMKQCNAGALTSA